MNNHRLELPSTTTTQRLVISRPSMAMLSALQNYIPNTIPDPTAAQKIKSYQSPFSNIQKAVEHIIDYGNPKHSYYQYYYSTKDNPQEILGNIAIEARTFNIELSWFSALGAPRKGYTTEAARGLIDQISQQTTRPIEALIATNNRPSQRLAQRLGMTAQRSIKGACFEMTYYEIAQNQEAIAI